ncbi:hypothetical protein [Microbacterium sp. MYb62]|uniref:hypothetical protein n=1 Tax=Microbacterium sp. MYb62 TaxID=1848690 RepID=UPI000CFC81A0|nr:hypothetical protein [Microbacterium sp. MYb62]PRB14489.1 hypothetical protein CQ042_11265 [Microbacterium sp. MYb62]
MFTTPITVVVEQPLDLVGSVLVPAAAIIISALIAVSIARGERHAARQERKDVALANLMLALTMVDAIATDRANRAERNRRVTDFVAAANVAESVFSKDEYPVLELVVAIVLRDANRGRAQLSYAASAALMLLSDWKHGEVDTAEIQRHLDELTDWERGFVAKDWRALLNRAAGKPARMDLVSTLIGALRTARRSRG